MAQKTTETKEKSVFETLNSINVNGHTEKKNGLTYLSWAWCWAEIKKAFPDATYKIYENENGWNYFTDGHTCWVKTGVTIKDIENIEYLPVMDFRNASISVEKVTSFDVNKAIQRSLTKACARHGLGLYIYAGEDLPECDTKDADALNVNKEYTQPANDALAEAFMLIKQNIESAPSKQYLNDLHQQNQSLHSYEPYRQAMNKRFKEVA